MQAAQVPSRLQASIPIFLLTLNGHRKGQDRQNSQTQENEDALGITHEAAKGKSRMGKPLKGPGI